jgi:hypothetical protein
VCEHTREMQRVGVIRRDLENRAVDVRRGRQLLRLLQRDRDRDRLVERQSAVGVRGVTPPCWP